MTQGALSLANKYRPLSFDDGMIGQKHIVEILKNKMKSDSSALQNYLFYGPRGTGKTTSARILAKAINCLNLQNGNPCNECANCKMIQEGTTLDYVEIDAASMTGVDNIRDEVIAKMVYPPTQLKKKIYVIDEVHMLSKSAFNALLKTIEEPWSKVSFILATTELDKVLDTIISRCQVFQFKKVGEDDIVSRLEYICQKEWFQYEKEALYLIAMLSDGCVRDAIKYLDQVSILPLISQNDVAKLLWISSENTLKEFLDLIKEGNLNTIFQTIDTYYLSGIDLSQFAKQMIRYLDRHFLDDVDFSLSFSPVLFNILRQIRYYPYQTILYKMEISSFLRKDIPEVAENMNQKSNEWSSSLNTGNSEKASKETSFSEKTFAWEPWEFQELWNLTLQSLPDALKGTKMGILQKDVSIQSINGNQVSLLITDKIAETILEKPDVIQVLAQNLSKLLNKEVEVSTTFMSKETLAWSLF